MKRLKETTTLRRHRIEFTGVDLLQLLEAVGAPLSSEVFVEVPTGGDYSGCKLSIDEEMPLIIQWSSAREAPDVREEKSVAACLAEMAAEAEEELRS